MICPACWQGHHELCDEKFRDQDMLCDCPCTDPPAKAPWWADEAPEDNDEVSTMRQ
jgi:hypothetical protein